MDERTSRRITTGQRIEELKSNLNYSEKLISDKACVYATGSFGRFEASKYSDLDLFIVGDVEVINGKEVKALRTLDEICLKADLIRATRDLSIPDFDGDGRYLVHYSINDFTKTLGKPEDDLSNTFTGRLLLLLESRSLLEESFYNKGIQSVLEAYWRDYEGHEKEFMPAFLANDILRLWRTFCVNYEARTLTIPEEQRMKRKIKNYKLKHSRLLTCFSALLYLLAVYRQNNTVSMSDATAMIAVTPTERLEWLRQQPDLSVAQNSIDQLLVQYNQFLKNTDVEEMELIKLFEKEGHEYMNDASKFGDTMFNVMNSIGNGNKFHRLIVV